VDLFLRNTISLVSEEIWRLVRARQGPISCSQMHTNRPYCKPDESIKKEPVASTCTERWRQQAAT